MTALILVALMIVCYLLGATAFFVLAAVVVTIAAFELLDALVQTGHRPSIPLGLAGSFGMMLVAFLERPVYIPVIVAATLFCAFFLALRPNRGPAAVTDIAWTMLSLLWVGGGGAAAVSMLTLGDDGVLLLVGFVCITALNDIGAYFAGTNLGRNRMAPSISPGKSWEGAVGGFLTSIAAGAGFGALAADLSVVDGLALGLISGLLAPVGDLMESLAKREIGIKDSGRLLPGHGGFLDRLDAIIFCAPPAFLYLRFLVF
ncbi:MAG: phosphatidate cytidylyltransferase [Actinomycetota bacterium]|nr:phosphatidate cytidylyltransferase [Actinomycetota bacterium]